MVIALDDDPRRCSPVTDTALDDLPRYSPLMAIALGDDPPHCSYETQMATAHGNALPRSHPKT